MLLKTVDYIGKKNRKTVEERKRLHLSYIITLEPTLEYTRALNLETQYKSLILNYQAKPLLLER